jgi:hypothetical protein
VALKVGGLAGSDDKVKRLEAEAELLELRLQLAINQLEQLVVVVEADLKLGNYACADEVGEARAMLDVLKGNG